jgi:hypothetical protein
MNYLPIPELRSKIEQDFDGLKIIIPSSKHLFTIIFFSIWLIGWAVGEGSVISLFLNSDTPLHENLFEIFWLIGWTFGGVWAFYGLLWMLIGDEKIVIKGDSINIQQSLFAVFKGKSYAISDIKNIRVSNIVKDETRRNLYFPGAMNKSGIIAFDYGAKTIRFAQSVDESEANIIVQKMKNYNPILGR